ncbi:MAG: GNAT family N-acetyltransferase [Deltaproteobacteria bacterium]|jgi:predicted N-acetyltransferase YhbS|nr:MAG: GNAT family N-acetyltransferase [Deltaproteobacteria bacterium]
MKVSEIEFRFGNDLDLDQIIDLYNASTLGERRPVDDRRIMSDMLSHANLVVTAWDGALLIGIARTLTDFSYVGYLADLAVRASHQRQGIGIELIERTRQKMGPRSMLVLLAAPKAVEYYPNIGFTKHESAWTLRANQPFPISRH